MADRTVAVTDTLETFRTDYNSTAGDVGDIADLLSATVLSAMLLFILSNAIRLEI